MFKGPEKTVRYNGSSSYPVWELTVIKKKVMGDIWDRECSR